VNGVLTEQLHELVNSLGASLDLPVELTDLQLNRIARSIPAGVGTDDFADTMSPRHLGVSIHAAARLLTPVYFGGSDDLGMPSTLVIPVRSPGAVPSMLLWITCVRGPISGERIQSVTLIAESTVGALETAGVLSALEWADDHFGRAFSTGDIDRLDEMLGESIQSGALRHDGAFVCLAISIPGALESDLSGTDAQRRLTAITHRFAEAHPRDRCLIAFSGSVSFALLAPRQRDVQESLPDLLVSKAADLIFRSRTGGVDLPWLVAVSSLVADRASTAIWQARQSLDLAQAMGHKHQVVSWAKVAHMRGIAAVPTDILQRHFISPTLRSLMTDESAQDLVQTLRLFLSTAGNVKTTAEVLYLHRASVYHRLRRAEELLGVDLSQGSARLEIHMGLVAADIVENRRTLGGS
jgi:hypothetical protein